MNEEIEELKNKIEKLKKKFWQVRTLNKNLRLQIKEVLIANNRLEKEIKQYKQDEANKLSGLLSIGVVYKPKIDRDYKFKE